MARQSREVRFARRPTLGVAADNFELAVVDLPTPRAGEVLVRNLWMSVDPYMRLALTNLPGVHAPKSLGGVMDGAAVGVVEQSAVASLPVGVHVLSQFGWRDAFVAPAVSLQRIDTGSEPLSWHVGLLGLVGVTAYSGVEYVLQPKAGDTLYVSAAAGAVGSLACQLAKKRGARVIGTAGSDEKVAWLRDVIGLDAAANYKTTSIREFLSDACSEGLDLYFDNVGGETLNAVLGAMKRGGHIALCGSISQYEDANYRAGPSDFFSVIEKGLTLTGFSAGTWRHRSSDILEDLARRLSGGELIWEETIVGGLENAPAAFAAMLKGDSLGKMVVRLG